MRERLYSLTATTPLFLGVYTPLSVGKRFFEQGRGVVSRYSYLLSKSPTTPHGGVVCQVKLGVQHGW